MGRMGKGGAIPITTRDLLRVESISRSAEDVDLYLSLVFIARCPIRLDLFTQSRDSKISAVIRTPGIKTKIVLAPVHCVVPSRSAVSTAG